MTINMEKIPQILVKLIKAFVMTAVDGYLFVIILELKILEINFLNKLAHPT